MKLIALFFCILSLLGLSRAQFGFGDFNQFSAYTSGSIRSLQSARDPRQNPGPVVFPPAPPDNGETSGVVVGASGYGFVPPNKPRYHTLFFF